MYSMFQVFLEICSLFQPLRIKTKEHIQVNGKGECFENF